MYVYMHTRFFKHKFNSTVYLFSSKSRCVCVCVSL